MLGVIEETETGFDHGPQTLAAIQGFEPVGLDFPDVPMVVVVSTPDEVGRSGDLGELIIQVVDLLANRPVARQERSGGRQAELSLTDVDDRGLVAPPVRSPESEGRGLGESVGRFG